MKEMKIMSVGRPKKQNTEAEYRRLFDSHIEENDSGCYLWTASKNNIGFGFFRYHDKMQTAHRVQLKLLGQNIDGKTVHHICDNYHCVNPAHLVAGTLKQKGESVAKKGRAGRICTDPTLFKTCEHCGYHGNQAVLAHVHGDKCKHKP